MFVPYYVVVMVVIALLMLIVATVGATITVRKLHKEKTAVLLDGRARAAELYQKWSHQGELHRAWEILSLMSDVVRTYVSGLSGVSYHQGLAQATPADATVAMDDAGQTLPFGGRPEAKAAVLALHKAETSLLECVSALVRAGGSRTMIAQALTKVVSERCAMLAGPLTPGLLDAMLSRLVEKITKLPKAGK